MNSMVEFAELFKDRDNPDIADWVTGEVTSVSPIQIRISDKISFNESKILLPERLAGQLLQGDLVVLFPSQDYKRAFIADKVVKG